MARLILSDQAERDLDAVYRQGFELFGLAQADRYIDGLLETLDVIADFPGIARARHELPKPARVYPYRSHVIVYDIDDSQSQVTVVRIRHGHEDWTAEAHGDRQ